MSDFDDLPLSDGVGPEHVNQFRIYFRAPPGKKPKDLGKDFTDNFPNYFNPNVADCVWGRDDGHADHQGGKTIRFALHLAGLPDFHSDWTAVCSRRDDDNCNGFAAKTLKRNFTDAGDAKLVSLLLLLGGGGASLIPVALHHNKFHFLAGRRSWMICDAANSPSPAQPRSTTPAPSSKGPAQVEKTNVYVRDLLFLDTAAIERDSKGLFGILEHFPTPVERRGLLSYRENIVTIWCTLLQNYIQRKSYEAVAPPEGASSWSGNRGYVYYRVDAAAAAHTGEIRAIHPALGS